MPTSKQRRENARRRLERQIQRRQEAAAKRRRRNIVTAAFLSVIVVVAGVWVVWARAGGNDDKAAAETPSPTPSASAATPTPSRAAKKTNGPCAYTETDQTLTNPDAKDVGLPPDPAKTPATGKVNVTMATNQGNLTITLDRASAPCSVQSWEYLISKKFFDATPCPRVSDAKTGGLSILQCGAATVSGGPTYQYKEENLAKAAYKKGVVAMANGGAGTTGSQFFIIWEDATGLQKNYSVVGTVTKGLDVITKVGQGGNDGSNQAGGGVPKLAITITSMRINK